VNGGTVGAPKKIEELVERFSDDKHELNEAQVRQSYIDPLFECLGWDVASKKGKQQAVRDVVLEDSIRVENAKKAPDYGFYFKGSRKFFVEAKEPSVNIAKRKDSAFQLRRYGWSAQLPVSILTDFEEFAIYDCGIQPKEADEATTARIEYIKFDQYDERWDEIEGLFSRKAVGSGSLDAFTRDKKKGAEPVDKAFLREIESWREGLAKDIHIRNPSLDRYTLNYAVQVTIDRIVFLRVCEDRGVEEYGRLENLLENGDVYDGLSSIFKDADDRYNSGLFHFQKEQERGDPDDWTLDLGIQDEVLKKVIRSLYYPKSPYQFSVMPVEILGQAYEQFLGKVISVEGTGSEETSDGSKVVVEEKPEVRKAGGVYYTPTYIVDYIVEHTVGKLVEGKTPKQVSKLKIVDPACGSGTFLIGAYDCLLDWHLRWYIGDGPEKHKNAVFEHEHWTDEGAVSEWRLRGNKKKDILLNNIHGVDIDFQAVEVTKLSLLLKVLEGETSETVNDQPSFFRERALPDLSNNIKCGNSLIGHDFYDNEQMNLLDEDEQRRINTFDWHDSFPEVFSGKNPGFDAVIGNPPYIFTRNQGIDELQKTYFYSHYRHQSSQLNTFGIFVERCYALLRESGVLGFITPNNWLTIQSFIPLRKFVLESTTDIKIVNILDRVFTAADVDTAIVVLGRGISSANLTIAEIVDREEAFSENIELSAIKPPAYIIQISLLKDSRGGQLLERIESCSQPLSAFCTVSTGLKAYQRGKGKPPQTTHEKENRVFHNPTRLDDTYSPYLQGVDVRRYLLAWSGEYLSYGDWLAEPRKSVPFTGERLLVRQIPSVPPYLVHGVFTDGHFYNDINSMVVFAPIENLSLKYLLGLLNSRLLSAWFLKTFDKLQRKIFPQFKVKELATFPIRTIDFSDREDADRHERMVDLVEQMLVLHEQLSNAKVPADKNRIQGRIRSKDNEIDQLIYELYGLSEEEIEIVEGKD
jgi:hypothetical protein